MDLKQNRKKLKESVRLQLERELYKKSFYDFFIKSCKVLEPATDWQFNWHIKYICDQLQAELERIKAGGKRTKHLIINVPPRTSKSTITTIVFPVWAWIVFPEAKLLTISYSDSLATEHSTQSMRLLQTEWFKKLFPEIQLTDNQYSKSNYTNTKGGMRKAVGMMASILGFSADIVLLDDPNNADANQLSIANLESVSNVYRSTVSSRLNNPNTGLRVIIQQRLHEKDLTGYLLKNHANLYNLIRLPVELTDDVSPVELRENYQGEPDYEELLAINPDFKIPKYLWPERFNREVLDNEKSIKGTYGYTSQYLLRASAVEGGIIKRDWLQFVEQAPVGVRWFIFIDSAYTQKKSNDPSAIMVAGVDGGTLYIKEVFQVWLEFPELIKKIQQVASNYPNCMCYVEPKSSGISLVQSLRANSLLNIAELEMIKGDKLTKVNAIAPKLESMRVKLVRSSDWNENFIHECTAFPNALHDDMVDTLVFAVNKLLVNSNRLSYRMY